VFLKLKNLFVIVKRMANHFVEFKLHTHNFQDYLLLFNTSTKSTLFFVDIDRPNLSGESFFKTGVR
jgi:hypothetical protein